MADIDTAQYPCWLRTLGICLVPGVTACSLIYSAGDFELPDAAPDADTSPCVGMDGTEMAVLDVHRVQVYEGEGCIMDGDGEVCAASSRGVPVVVRGCNIPADATVTVSGAGFDGTPADAIIGASGRFVAFTLRVPVRADLVDGMSEEVSVTIDGSAPQMFTVLGLDEFVASAVAMPDALDAGTLKAMYSRVEIDTELTLTGDKDHPARFIATSELILGALVHASGQPGAADSGGAGGPGGCSGGNAASPGACSRGGGQGTSDSQGSGGGGGGHAEPGTDGGGGGGAGGGTSGTRTLSPIANTPELGSPRGQGGGGGGNGEGATTRRGGGGGGGGGFIELTSRGTLQVTGSATLFVTGGIGAPAPDGCPEILPDLFAGGGNGGGGSGGAILVRTAFPGTGIQDLAVNVEGGAGGGASDPANDCHAGGAGARGRVRVDLPGSEPLPASVAGLPVASRYRGPVIAPDLPAIVTEPTVTVTVHGGLSESYWIERRTLPATTPVKTAITIEANQTTTVELALEPGYNELCALVDADNTPTQPEGRNCLAIAYIP